jgi:transcriptional regulator with XRE-family HTH domain
VSDLSKLQKFTEDSYRVSYLDAHVKGAIAYQIQALREKLGLNQTQFGALIGMPQPVVSRLESTEYGGVNINTLLQIANRLGIGLNVNFCNFETVLDTDVSPSAFAVETITETIGRLSTAAPSHPAARIATASAIVVIEATSIQRSGTWQMPPIPNQPDSQLYPGSETSTFGKFTPMPLSLG